MKNEFVTSNEKTRPQTEISTDAKSNTYSSIKQPIYSEYVKLKEENVALRLLIKKRTDEANNCLSIHRRTYI